MAKIKFKIFHQKKLYVHFRNIFVNNKCNIPNINFKMYVIYM